MSLTGHKRKLSETDEVDDSDLPPTKQQRKLEKNEDINDDEVEDIDVKPDPNATSTSTSASNNSSNSSNNANNGSNSSNSSSNDSNDSKDSKASKNSNHVATKFDKLVGQIEFYFSNSNLPLDSFMLDIINEHDGWFPLETLLTFKKVNQITNDLNLVRQAVKKSEKLIINEEEDKLKRNDKLLGRLPAVEEVFARSIFAKGFSPRMSFNDLLKFWKKVGNVNSVRMITNFIDCGRIVKESGKNSKNSKKLKNNQNNEENQIKEEKIDPDETKRAVIKRFMGDCYVEFASVEEKNKFVGMTFNCNKRVIVTGERNDYRPNEDLIVVETEYEFESDRVLLISNLSALSTHCDIKNWINNENKDTLLENNKYFADSAKYKHKGKINIKAGFVLKKRNETTCYVRLRPGKESCGASDAAGILSRRPFMGIMPKVYVLADNEAKKIWSKVATNRYGKVRIEKKEKGKLPATIVKHVKQYKANQKYYSDLRNKRKQQQSNNKNKNKNKNKKGKDEKAAIKTEKVEKIENSEDNDIVMTGTAGKAEIGADE